MTFYFAWVDKDDITYGPEFQREDEQVFAFSLQQSEGEFAALEIDLVNPRIGLLAPSRKQWAWLAWRDPATSTVHPLFFGRLVAVPQELQDNVVRLSFVARPVDFEEQKEYLAASLRVAPYYDPVWLSEEEQADPDRVLEGRSALWHIDRVTHEVTISDIITGEDGQIDLEPTDAFYDSVSVSYSQSPARACIVEATVQWSQRGSGNVDITNRLLKVFQDSTPSGLTTFSGNTRPSKGMMNVLGGDEAMQAWPQPGASVGGGWSVGHGTNITLVGDPPIVPTNIAKTETWGQMRQFITLDRGVANLLRDTFEQTPGFVAQIIDTTTPQQAVVLGPFSGEIQVLWIPIWRLSPKLILHWEAERDRTEVVRFTVNADVQPLLTDPGEEEVVRLTFGPADVDEFIPDVRHPRYFSSARGIESFEYLVACARANLLARSRAIDVDFEVRFALAPSITCRKSMVLQDPRLPGGVAAGKVRAYTISADGGKLNCAVTIGCCVGRNGNIDEVQGDPGYVEDGYVDDAYQTFDGAIVVPIAGEIGYSGMTGYEIDDDGVRLTSVNAHTFIQELSVTGALEEQMNAVDGAPRSQQAIMKTVKSHATRIQVKMRNVTGGPFTTNIAPTMTDLAVPRTIDLEVES